MRRSLSPFRGKAPSTLPVDVSRGKGSTSRQSTPALILGPARPPVDVAFLRVEGDPGGTVCSALGRERTVEEFDSARATLDAWRRKRCLKTTADWQSLDEAIALNLIRSRLRTEGKTTLNVREGMPASDLLRRAFLRAYAHEALGLTKTYSYPALARWLTDLGYPTKVSEPRSAKSQKVVLGCVPRTEEVMALFGLLQAEFPGAELGRLLAGVGD